MVKLNAGAKERLVRADSGSWFAGLVKNILLASFSILVTLILGEIVLRFAPLEITKRIQNKQAAVDQIDEVHPKGLYKMSSKSEWTLTPKFSGQFIKDDFNIKVKANALGLRDKDYGSKADGVVRIAGLGDSFAFGWGVENEQGFLKRLEAGLNQKRFAQSRKYEVINMGMPGYGTYEASKMAHRAITHYDPDLILLSFYEGNDYGNNLDAPRTRIIEGGYLKTVQIKKQSKFWGAIVKHSILAALLDVKLANLERKRGLAQAVQKTKGYLLDIRDLAKKSGIPFVFVFLPDQDPLFYTRSSLLHSYDRLAAGMSYGDIRNDLEAFCEIEGIHFYSLSESFQGAQNAKALRLKDTHFNSKGHQAAAEEIQNYLMKEGLVN